MTGPLPRYTPTSVSPVSPLHYHLASRLPSRLFPTGELHVDSSLLTRDPDDALHRDDKALPVLLSPTFAPNRHRRRIRTAMASKKIRCNAKDCKEAAQRIVGDCGFCKGHYCGNHRLLEDHKCSGLEDVRGTSPLALWVFRALTLPRCQCKKQSHERNAAQLEAERTQVMRV